MIFSPLESQVLESKNFDMWCFRPKLSGSKETIFSPTSDLSLGDRHFLIVSDESEYQNKQYTVSIVVLDLRRNEEFNEKKRYLGSVVNNYSLKDIHFNNFFGKRKKGKNKLSSSQRDQFIKEYLGVVKGVPLICLGKTSTQEVIDFRLKGITDKQNVYIHLLADLIAGIIPFLPTSENSTIQVCREEVVPLKDCIVYNDKSKSQEKLIKAILDKYYMMHRAISPKLPEFVSLSQDICFFQKNCFMYSSLADLAAYTFNMVGSAIDREIPSIRILKNYGKLLGIFKEVFPNSYFYREDVYCKEFYELLECSSK